jgi:putative membrane protein
MRTAIMNTRWIIAVLHLLGMALALGSATSRARAFEGPLDTAGVQRVLRADNYWALSALILLGTGLWRAFGGLEKGTSFYLDSNLFWIKMTLFLVILVLEVGPMVALIQWRAALRKSAFVDTSRAALFARISATQAVLVGMMVVAAAGMARAFDL